MILCGLGGIRDPEMEAELSLFCLLMGQSEACETVRAMTSNTAQEAIPAPQNGTVPPGRFPMPNAAPASACPYRVVKAAKRAGLSAEVSAHWLRHAHASHSLDRGAPIHLVQQTLGHASVATTGRYLHARPTDSSARYLGV